MFLVSDARRARAPDLERYFGTRALVSAIVTGALAAAGLVVLRSDARFVFDGLKGDALPLVILSVVCGSAVLVLLRRNARRGARVLAAGAVACVIWAWGVAQHPYLLPQKLTIAAAAAPSATLTSLLIVFGVAVLVVLPSLGLLFTLVQRNLVRETSSPDDARQTTRRHLAPLTMARHSPAAEGRTKGVSAESADGLTNPNGGRATPDPVELLRSRSYLVLLVFGAVVGVLAAAVAFFFLKAVEEVQHFVFTSLPTGGWVQR